MRMAHGTTTNEKKKVPSRATRDANQPAGSVAATHAPSGATMIAAKAIAAVIRGTGTPSTHH